MTGQANHKGVRVSDQGDGTYINPIIHADYSDPDVIRVGDDFFLTASSFTNMPGLPILHSRDLVNWKIVNHVVDRFPFEAYDRVQHGCGIWAPSLRYHDGKFWVFFGAPDEGIFMSNTTDPFGKWSPLVCVREAKGWIDTCPFWDDDGQAYLVHAYAQSRCGIKNRLAIHRMKPDGTQLLDEGTIVFEDPERHPTMEGPKMYKRNGFYYIFAPAGGVKAGWQTVLRSRNVFGPYEDRVVLHQGNTDINGPHQGGLVELESGESWFVHFQDKDAYGRVVHLQPVRWVDDWPVMGINQDEYGRGEPVLRYRKPDVGRSYPIEVPATTDYFGGERLGLQWQWQANPNPGWSSLTGSSLKLYSYPIPSEPKMPSRTGVLSGGGTLSGVGSLSGADALSGTDALSGMDAPSGTRTLWDAPNLLLQKFPAPCFQATTRLVLHAERPDTYAGLTVMGLKYAYVSLSQDGSKYRLRLVLGDSSCSSENEVDDIALETNDVYLRVRVDEGAKCTFSYSTDGELYRPIGSVFQAIKGHWIGAKVGLFCVNRGQSATAEFGEFHWFVVE